MIHAIRSAAWCPSPAEPHAERDGRDEQGAAQSQVGLAMSPAEFLVTCGIYVGVHIIERRLGKGNVGAGS